MSRDDLPTGEDTSITNDVADPDPSTVEDYDKIPHAGGVRTRKARDIGPNSHALDVKAPPRPKNEGWGLH